MVLLGISEFRVLPLVLFSIILLTSQTVHCAEVDVLFQSINTYRTSQNLTTLTKNDNAECLAQKLANQLKDQACSNNTGPSMVPGTETQFTDFPSFLSSCHLNITNTRDGKILPACVPNLDPTLVLNNYTKAQYSGYINDTRFTGIGLGSAKDWIVVILSTNTSDGSYVNSQTTGDLGNLSVRIGPFFHPLLLLGSLFLLFH